MTSGVDEEGEARGVRWVRSETGVQAGRWRTGRAGFDIRFRLDFGVQGGVLRSFEARGWMGWDGTGWEVGAGGGGGGG